MDFNFLEGKTNQEIKRYIDIFKIFNMLNQEIVLYFARETNIEILKYINENPQIKKYNSKEEIIYEEIKKSIVDKDFNKFKFFIENFKDSKILLEELKQNKESGENTQKQLNTWLEEKCEKLDSENIKLLLDYGASSEILCEQIKENITFLLDCGAFLEPIYKQIKEAIEKRNILKLKFFVRNFNYKITLEQLNEYISEEKNLQKQLNIWLKYKCNESKYTDMVFLLQECGADKKIINQYIEKVIETKVFDKFKFITNNYIEFKIITKKEIQEIVNSNQNLQNILNIWLEEKCEKLDNENIKLLLEYGAKEGIIYEQIKKAIKVKDINKIEFILEKFKNNLSLSKEEIKQIKEIQDEERERKEIVIRRRDSDLYDKFNPYRDTNPH